MKEETKIQIRKRIELSKTRRKWINKEFADKTRGTHMQLPQKRRLLKRLWREAKRKFR